LKKLQKINPKGGQAAVSVKSQKFKPEQFVDREEQRVFEELRQSAKLPRE